MVLRTTVTQAVFFASLSLAVSFQYASAETYYILPTPTAPCPEDGVPCFTLSQYAVKQSNYIASDTIIMILLPGNHTLDSELTIRNTTYLKFEALFKGNFSTFLHDSSGPNQTTVTCSLSARFKFEMVEQVQVSGITFVGCMNNNANKVEKFSIENCSFQGEGRNGTGLHLKEVDNANIVKSSFSSNTGTDIYEPRFRYNPVTRRGGGMVIRSCRNVNITDCMYRNNSVTSEEEFPAGGAMAAMNSSITITNSTFTKNSVSGEAASGGAVDTDDFCGMIFVNNSTFTNNAVTGNGSAGGAMQTVSREITILNSTFTNNSVSGYRGDGGAVYFLLSRRSSITNSIFYNNSVTGDRGHGGAMSADLADDTVTLTKCTFKNNHVIGNNGAEGGAVYASSSAITATNTSFANNSVTGDGGNGGALSLHDTTMTSSTKTSFQYNVASTGVVVARNSRVHFSGSTTISNNYGSLYALSSNITFAGPTNIMNNSFGTFMSSRVSHSEEGGGVTAFHSNLFFNDNVNIEYNTGQNGGGISVTESKVYTTRGGFTVARNTELFSGGGIIYIAAGLFQITVAHNTALFSGGGIYAYQSELTLIDGSYVTIFGNTANEAGGGMHAIGSTTVVRGPGYARFIGNHAKRGGGMSFVLDSKLYALEARPNENHCSKTTLEQCVHLEFTENSAEYGGALYVYDDTNSGTCQASSFSAQSTASSECFFQTLAMYLDSDHSLYLEKNSNTYFNNNTATVAGGSIYGGLLDRCKVSPFSEIFIKYPNLNPSTVTVTATWYFLNITNLQPQDFNSRAIVSSDPVRLCFCRENHPDCSYQPPPMYVKKGETFKISVVAVDQVNNTIEQSRIHASLSQGGGLGEWQSIQQSNIDGSCTELTYNVLSQHNSEQLHLYAQGPCMGIGISTANVTVHIVPCPIGFKETDSLRCDCDPLLLNYVSNCSIDNESVLRKDSTWFSVVNDTEYQGYIFHKHCPFDYCQSPTQNVSVNLNNPAGSNELCAFNRSGKLCGSCEEGLSLSLGSSRCMPCSNKWLALLLIFATAGVTLVAFILWCNMTVAVGTINGLTFYANVFSTNRAIFFPFLKPSVLTVFVAWLNLDFGFETCFYDGMDEYVKTWLQLAFPIYVITLVIAIIVISDYSPRFASLFTGKNPVATLATLILLSYTKLLRVIIASLSVTTLDYSDGSHDVVWLADGNVPYLKGKHIPLFVTALVIVIVGIVYTSFLLCWQWLVYCPNKKPWKWVMTSTKVIAFMDAYHNPFHRHHRHWIGLLLLVRVLLYVLSALNVFGDPRINLLSVNTTMVVLVFFQLTAGYKHKIHKKFYVFFIENISFFNLILLTSVTYFVTEDSKSQSAVAHISLAIAFATFLVILVYHTFAFGLRKSLRIKIHKQYHRMTKRRNTNHHGLQPTAFSLTPSELQSITVSEIGLPEPVDTDSDECNSTVEDETETTVAENDESVEDFIKSKSFNTVCDVEYELHNLLEVPGTDRDNHHVYKVNTDFTSPDLEREDSDEQSVAEDESTPLLS